jgi:hypothetical protein
MSDKAEIWAPTQNPQTLQREIANMFGFRNIFDKVLGLKGKDVIVHVTFLAEVLVENLIQTSDLKRLKFPRQLRNRLSLPGQGKMI